MRFSPIRAMSAPVRSAMLLVIGIIAAALSGIAFGDERIDFNRDIRPILSNNCFKCHGPDAKQRQADLRLDIYDSATKPAESGNVAIVPGHSLESDLVRRIRSNDDDERMPPPDTHKQLTSEEKALLVRWIDTGAH